MSWNVLMIGSVMNARETAAFCAVIVALSTVAGRLHGALCARGRRGPGVGPDPLSET